MLELQHLFDVDRREEDYSSAIEGKTAALFATSCRIGGMVSGVGDPTLDALTRFGRHLGMCFQIVDDVLDLSSTDDALGKHAGQDLLEGIYTLPVIYMLRESAELRELLGGPLDPEQLDAARALALGPLAAGSTAVDVALGVARDHAVKAGDALDGADGLDPDVCRTLGRLVDGLVTAKVEFGQRERRTSRHSSLKCRLGSAYRSGFVPEQEAGAMGLFDKVKEAKQRRLTRWRRPPRCSSRPACRMGADMPGMGGQDMAAMAAYSAKVNKLAQSGVEAPGVIHTITATGTPDMSGATMHAIAVTYRPEGGDPIETTIEQSLLPFQLERTLRGHALHREVRPRQPVGGCPAELVGGHDGPLQGRQRTRSRAPRSSATTTAACRRSRAPSRTSRR